MTRSKCKYPGQNIALISAEINEIVAKLPKGHNWGTVKVERSSEKHQYAGEAICINCGIQIIYVSLFSSEWVDSKDVVGKIKACEEYKMTNALE